MLTTTAVTHIMAAWKRGIRREVVTLLYERTTIAPRVKSITCAHLSHSLLEFTEIISHLRHRDDDTCIVRVKTRVQSNETQTAKFIKKV